MYGRNSNNWFILSSEFPLINNNWNIINCSLSFNMFYFIFPPCFFFFFSFLSLPLWKSIFQFHRC